MKRLLSALKRFFLPPAGSPLWLRILPFVVMGILTLGVITGSVYGWSYTNSSEFCGSACHTMPPQYNAYLQSPHARVQCVECHIGRDIVTTQFTRKAGDLRHVVRTITQDYEFPIEAHEMRPARETCEQCHFPEKFSDDSLREIRSYANDVENSAQTTYLVLKTGGGSQREGLGRGIHWHIENEVFYLAAGDHEEEIPYVRAIDAEGNITEYYDIAGEIEPEDVAGSTLTRMDCITCHNRITHKIPDPEESIDQALSKGLISSDLPEVRGLGVSLLYEAREEGYETAVLLNNFYAFYDDNYPTIATEQAATIEEAALTIADIHQNIVFEAQNLDWATHPNNIGHKDTPGCFRCHDGKHLTGSEEAIRLECNLCHSVPVVSDSGDLVANLEIARGPEPRSHTHTSWITLHGQAIDRSCATCHEPLEGIDYIELEGKPPSGPYFCGNSACHDPDWIYTGFNSTALEPVLDRQLYILLNTSPYLLEGVPPTYENIFQAMFEGRCTFCHSGPEAEGGLDLSSYEALMAGGESGPAVVPGDPEASLLIERQSGSSEHFGQVLDEELAALQAWIEAGAPEGR